MQFCKAGLIGLMDQAENIPPCFDIFIETLLMYSKFWIII